MPLHPGQILSSRYRIVKLLGQGGFGAVYKAWDLNMDSHCAVKENLDTSQEAVRQFKREATILHKLRHTSLPRVTDHFSIPGQGQYLVMDFVEGEDLQAMLNQAGGPLPEGLVLPWMAQVCDALTYLHSQEPPIIHRDIKPANIKITPKGNAMLVDFGIAKVFDPALSTTVGARAITPGYSPHEQYGQGKTDARTDIYALGATLYTLLTGQAPVESIQRVVKDPLPAPERINPTLTPVTSAAIRKAMQVDSDLRWENTNDFKKALTATPSVVSTLPLPQTPVPPAVSIQPAVTQPVIPQPAPFRLGRLSKWLLYAAGLVVVILLAIWLWNEGGSSPLAATQTARAVGGTQTALVVAALPTDTPQPPVSPISSTSTPTPEPTQTAIPTQTALPPTPANPTWSSDGMVGVYIPAGEFEMGSKDGMADERPVHTVYLDAYFMDQTEVTFAQFKQFMAAADYTAQPCGDGDDHPVACATWNDARAYCEWAGRRLPTEAEWEKAARGGLVGKEYPWGDEAPVCTPGEQNGTQFDPCEGHTMPIKTFAPNGYGLFDMAGNVWEWVMDWYQDDYYASSPAANPQGPPSGVLHILRGGGRLGIVSTLRVASRFSYAPTGRLVNLFGFRCAQSGATQSQPPLEAVTPVPTTSSSSAPGQTMPTPGVLSTQISAVDNMVQMYIPAGEFKMGSEGVNEDEAPVHTVYLDAYFMDQTEVTVAQFQQFMAAADYIANPCGDGDDLPVACVTWFDAQAYCEWAGRRLPTEAEWEKAARGGLEGKAYPWGDETPVCTTGRQNGAQYVDCDGDAAPVMTYAANGYGLYDMAGNVWEWVSSLYMPYPYDGTDGREDLYNSGSRVLRGGGWSVSDNYLLVANRSTSNPIFSSSNFGFRCAQSVTTQFQPTMEAVTPVPTTSSSSAPGQTMPTPGVLSTQISAIDDMVLMYIPAGEFEMGNKDGSNDERPVHTVYLDAFWMDQTEVTNVQFRKFTEEVNYYTSGSSGYGDYYPASPLTWDDAQAYCQWAWRRLPTEAEWEKAARGGLEGKKYPWGDEAPVCTPGAQNGAQYVSCGMEPVPVKTFGPNGYGLYDMVGSVWEWVADWYLSNYYTSSPSQNPLGPASGDFHVLRGGGWNFSLIFMGVAYRNFHPKPEFSYPDLGFRCAVDAKQ